MNIKTYDYVCLRQSLVTRRKPQQKPHPCLSGPMPQGADPTNCSGSSSVSNLSTCLDLFSQVSALGSSLVPATLGLVVSPHQYWSPGASLSLVCPLRLIHTSTGTPFIKVSLFRDFSSGPRAQPLHSRCRGPRFDPRLGELDLTSCN